VIAELGMYPFTSVRWAWDELWRAVHARAPWTPAELAFSGDVHARWDDPECVVNQVCGWPLARYHLDRHRVVGTFALDIAEADGHRYRSVLVSNRAATLDELVTPDTHAVANSADSLSGWVSFLNATVGPDGSWPGTVTFTSAHVDSLRRVADGEADLASIDSWTLALLTDEQPDLVARVHRVGLGPWIPSPAVTASVDVADADADALTDAFESATADPSLGDALAALRIAGFVRTTAEEYCATLDLATFPT
jgi:ABC-type phosphate/phosphonate transport system substrate-binding protein